MPANRSILRMAKLSLFGAVAVATFGTPAPIPAVSAVMAQSSNAAAICMARTSTDGSELNVIAPANNQKILRKKGFRPVPCNSAFASQSRREAYRDAICQLASGLDQEKQGLFEAARGERPSVLCGMAELAVGQWTRKGRK